ncbi:unnamed protein product [Paramecium octaurelia]|uniref:Uncharacterized protein n=1 Tax=Paramecium octaurelia TaxID=43137 RepID=A0A8S1YDS3_PAROT|nr:unnamed protein product [Paramecium octaurelia]
MKSIIKGNFSISAWLSRCVLDYPNGHEIPFSQIAYFKSAIPSLKNHKIVTLRIFSLIGISNHYPISFLQVFNVSLFCW